MGHNWFEIAVEGVDAEDIDRRVQQNLVRYTVGEGDFDLSCALKELWDSVIGEPVTLSGLEQQFEFRERDCDILPHYYSVGWRTPILGPIYAFLRRFIDMEIRRYLFPSLQKQSMFNLRMLRLLQAVCEENARLRGELAHLRAEEKE
ncbi:MAG: hypothetical protein JW963_24090 [Anaerolineales bacterium]|nr:hypothetical protein [Anaerolineales bacterium]